MSEYYTAYILRNKEQYEVTAKLYSHGKVEEGYDRWTGGHWTDVVDDPMFTDFVAFDDFGVEMILTPKEILKAEEQMVSSYWDNYTDVRSHTY